MAQFVVVLDATIVTTSLPVVREALGFTAGNLQWVVTAYTLVFGAGLIPGGRLADRAGARRVFLLGLVLFAAASTACAAAWSPAALIGARIVQGLGAALLAPAALALLTALTAPGPARRRAVGWWTAAAATGGASGWVAGGVLTQYLGWRSVFWVNVPIGLVCVVVALRSLPADARSPGRRSARAGSSVVAAILAAFRSRPIAGSALSAMALTASTTPAMYLCALYVQGQLGLRPAQGSLLFPVFNLAVVGASLLAPRVLRRLGPRATVQAGFVTIGAGPALLTTLRDGGTAIAVLLVAFTLMGAGLGAASVAATHTGTDAAEPAQQGVVAGILNTAAQAGTSLGLVLTPLATTDAGTASRYQSGFLGAVAVCAAGILISQLIPKARPRPPATPPEPGSAEPVSARLGPAGPGRS